MSAPLGLPIWTEGLKKEEKMGGGAFSIVRVCNSGYCTMHPLNVVGGGAGGGLRLMDINNKIFFTSPYTKFIGLHFRHIKKMVLLVKMRNNFFTVQKYKL